MLTQVLPVDFQFTMLKGRANYLCSHRLHKAMRQAGSLFTTPETEELRRIYEWSKQTRDGSLSDFEVEPDPKVWGEVCSERGLCSPKVCGPGRTSPRKTACASSSVRASAFSRRRAGAESHALLHLLGAVEEELEGGILFKNDFVVFDEAHTVEQVASRHIGLSVSHAQLRYTLNACGIRARRRGCSPRSAAATK
jgi:ATP-dependent DNA helicase DinG